MRITCNCFPLIRAALFGPSKNAPAETVLADPFEAFLSLYPELRACAPPLQKEAFDFYEKAQEAQSLIEQAQRIASSHPQFAQAKIDRAAALLAELERKGQ